MSGHAQLNRSADSNARVFLNWLKVVSLVTAIIAAVAIGIAWLLVGLTAEHAGRALFGAALFVGLASMGMYLSRTGVRYTGLFPMYGIAYVDAKAALNSRSSDDIAELMLLVVPVMVVLGLAGFALGAGR